MIDALDYEILNILQKDARTSNVDIARKIGLAPSATLERMRKLHAKGYIRQFEARLNAEKLGLDLLAFVFVRTNETGGNTVGPLLASLDEVQEVYNIAGEDCYLIRVRAKNTDELGKFLRDKITSVEHVVSTRTTIVLETFKETSNLYLEDEIRVRSAAG